MAGQRGQGRALYEEIKARILDGTYAAGAALPSTRAAAAERGLSRTTVTTVYEQLAAQGFIASRPGAGSRVAAGARSILRATPSRRASAVAARERKVHGPTSRFAARIAKLELPATELPSAGTLDFRYGPLAGADFPTLPWMKASRKVERERPTRLAYTDPRGDLRLRLALQSYLARARGITCSADQLVIVNGSQQALDLCARVLLDPGDLAVVENPGYRMAHHAFTAVGARLHGVPVDQHGMATDELRRVRKAALAYVTPTHQFPLGAFLTMPRRHALLEWAVGAHAWVVEDDYDSEYRYAVRPEPTLQSLDDRGCVIYIGTFSKTLSPQLRLGYMIVPGAIAGAFAAAKQLADRHTGSHAQRTLALLLEEGSYDRHVRRMRRRQDARRTALLAALDRHLHGRVVVEGSASGLHLVGWIKDVPAAREPDLVAAARKERVLVYPVGPLYLPGRRGSRVKDETGVLLGYATLEPAQIAEGIQRLAAAVRRVLP